MKAVARLVYSYFTCTAAMRWLTLGGIALIAVSLYVVTSLPQSEHMLAFAFTGIVAIFLGSSLMPLMFGRMAQSHAARVLPHARLKLLASAFITVAIVALPAGLLTPLAFVAGVSGELAALTRDAKLLSYTIDLALNVYTFTFAIAGWLYLAMWFVSSQRNLVGFAKGLLVILFLMLLPAREIEELSATTWLTLQRIAIVWTLFGAGFLLWPRWKALRLRRRFAAVADLGARFGGRVEGNEIHLVLGTAHPWLMIALQTVPIVMASRLGAGDSFMWLYYLTIFSTVSGAIAGQSAERSRALWLRGDWSRERLFAEVERSLWRHNSFVLGVLVLLMVGVGSYANLPVTLLAVGLPLLILGTVLSTYLGLMVTRGLRWSEASIGIGVMLALMSAAGLATRDDVDLSKIVALEVLLAALAAVLRAVAARRWQNIDWLLCRRDRTLVSRGAR